MSRAAVTDNVRTKRVYDPPAPEDGHRILVTRYWPRGVSRAAADEYDPKVAPSRELIRTFKREKMGWAEFERQFLAEMGEEPAKSEIARLADVARKSPITLMCMCEDEMHCHRSIVARLVREAAKETSA